jgi:mannose-6-phosphate isomerase-like protein (cupin superfamily)
MDVLRAERISPYVTRDGSSVREIAGPAPGNAANQSLAEATVQPGGQTTEHYHRVSEEIYTVVSGSGRMRLDDLESELHPGDIVVIPPGSRHKLWSGPGEPLVVLCSSSPPYSHDDTVLTE